MFTKMTKKDLTETIEVPEGITVTKEGPNLKVKGQKGEVLKRFDSPSVKIEVSGNTIKLFSPSSSKLEKAILFAYKAHINNALRGCQEPYVYVLKVCSGHFPMTVSVANNEIVIKNFLGEKVPRKVKLKPGVDVKVEGSSITVTGPDKELAAQVSADIEQGTRRPGFDKRIFQDGIYMIEKAGKKI